MEKSEREDLYNKALIKWGYDSQINMIEEECIELAHSICKLRRTRGDYDKKIENLVDELADVTIVMEESKIIFSNLQEAVKERIEYKLQRLKKRVEKENDV